MTKNPYIRSLLAGVLLLLFAFSITPKKVLHDLVVNHKDRVFKPTVHTQIDVSGFNCKCESFVAESPFDEPVDIIPSFSAPVFYTIHKAVAPQQIYSLHYFYFQHRGPPYAV